MMARLAFDRYYAELAAETEKLAAAMSDADLTAQVPTCPEWTLDQLVRHVGTGHRWAAGMVERRVSAPEPMDQSEVPAGTGPRSAWLLAGARRLATAVRECGPDAAVWTWAAEQTAAFWLRKMVHDGLIHRFDAEFAVGRDGPVAADLAADGVTDLLVSIATLSRPDSADPIFAELCGRGQTLHVHATDPGLGPIAEWLVRRTPAGVTWEHRHGSAEVIVSGPARQLLLLLNRRIPLDLAGVDVVGDTKLFQHWLENSAF
jgi:uncharacterized protein (TIGR03083 family)